MASTGLGTSLHAGLPLLILVVSFGEEAVQPMAIILAAHKVFKVVVFGASVLHVTPHC